MTSLILSFDFTSSKKTRFVILIVEQMIEFFAQSGFPNPTCSNQTNNRFLL